MVAFVCIVLSALFLYLKQSNDHTTQKINETLRVHCPLQSEPCLIHLAGGLELNIRLSPRGLPTFKPLTLVLESDQIDFSLVKWFEASFEGRDMEMGRHDLLLNPVIQSNTLSAVGSIPLCPMDPHMVWLLTIKFQYQNTVRLLKFEVASSNSH